MAIEKLRKQYTLRIGKLEDRIRRAGQAVERESEQAKQQKLQTAISFGATPLTALTGRKKMSRSTLSRASTTAGRAGRAMKEAKDIERAEENLEGLQNQRTELQARLEEEIEQITRSIDPSTRSWKLSRYVQRRRTSQYRWSVSRGPPTGSMRREG